SPTFGFVAVTTAIGYLQLFAEPYVMTQGGPGESTTSLVLLMYEEGFRWWNLGYAAAVAFVLFAIILAVTLVQRGLQPVAARAGRGQGPAARERRAPRGARCPGGRRSGAAALDGRRVAHARWRSHVGAHPLVAQPADPRPLHDAVHAPPARARPREQRRR